MMKPEIRVPFDPDEMTVIDQYEGFAPDAPKTPVLKTPIKPYENFKMFLSGETPLWMPSTLETKMFNPMILPDNIAKNMVTEGTFHFPKELIHKDYFGIEWEFVPSARGAIVRPGKPFLEDVNDWEEKIVFPDVSKFDWDGARRKNEEYLNDARAIQMTIFTGIFERLVSFMDMTPALVALIDEDQKTAVQGLFDRLCVFYDELFYHISKWFEPDLLWFHDDWGSQRAPLFSLEVCREMLVPYLRRIVDSAHKYGIGFEFHCCGNNELLVPAMIEAGVDMWAGQEMNDKAKLYQLYGKDIKLGIDPPPADPGASEEEIRDNVKRLLDCFPENCYVGLSFGMDPRYYTVIYEESRKRYNSVGDIPY